MSKYLIEASYTAEGVKGLMKQGGTARRAMVQKMVESLADLRHRKNISVSEIDTYKSAKTIWHYIFARLTG
jgi:glutamate synthase domain-containing protein 1